MVVGITIFRGDLRAREALAPSRRTTALATGHHAAEEAGDTRQLLFEHLTLRLRLLFDERFSFVTQFDQSIERHFSETRQFHSCTSANQFISNKTLEREL